MRFRHKLYLKRCKTYSMDIHEFFKYPLEHKKYKVCHIVSLEGIIALTY